MGGRFSGRCPRKSRSSAGPGVTAPRGAPALSDDLPLPLPHSCFFFIFLSSLFFSPFSLLFLLFFFVISVEPLKCSDLSLGRLSLAASTRGNVGLSWERAAFRDYAATGVSRAGCLIALARGSGIVLFHGLTAKWSNSAIDSTGAAKLIEHFLSAR